MDHVLSPHDWKGVAFRDPAFLLSDRLPATAKASLVDVEIVDRGAYDTLPQERRARTLPRGLSAAEARRHLESTPSTRDASIVRLAHTRDLLCGIGGARATREFNRFSRPLLRAPAWCARCDAGCRKGLPRWLSAEQINAGGRGYGEWCLHTPPPPLFEQGQCKK